MNTVKQDVSIVNKRKLLAAGCVLLCVLCFIIFYVCQNDYTSKKTAIIAAQQKQQEAWVNSTVSSVSYWLNSLDETAQKISTSDLYRMFAQEVASLDASATAALQQGQSSENEDMAALVEQLPLMQNVLRDFIQYYNIATARIVNRDGNTLLSILTSDPPISPEQQMLVQNVLTNNTLTLSAITKTSSGLMLEYGVPITPVMIGSGPPMAALLISRNVTNAVDTILSSTPLPNDKDTPLLLQRDGQSVRIITNTAGATLPEIEKLPEASALPFGLRTSFSKQGDVYSYATQVPGSQLWVVLETPASRVQSEIRMLAFWVFGLGIAVCVGLCLFAALLWWMLVGREQRAIADKFQKLYRVIAQQNTLLDGVNKSLGVGLAFIDKGGFVQVSNNAFAGLCTDASLLSGAQGGVNISTLFTGTVAMQLLLQVQSLQTTQEEKTFELEMLKNTEPALFRITMYAYTDAENTHAEHKPMVNGAVCIFQDITAFRHKNIEFQNRQRRIIEGLLKVVEGVDPYISGHSAMLQKLTLFMGKHLHLNENDMTLVGTAAYFSQIGKFFVPREILTKTEKLTPEELRILQQAPAHARTILENIDFGMPVASVVYQMYENIDGSGYPQGLSGEQIVMHARILGVANMFCAMTSPRAHRLAFTATQAMDQMKRMANQFDPDALNALFDVMHNNDEKREVFQNMAKPDAFKEDKVTNQ